jgi:hypothetical protein
MVNKTHYCFQGCSHDAICLCECLSCSRYREACELEKFNITLSNSIRLEELKTKFKTEQTFMKLMGDKSFVDALTVELGKEFEKNVPEKLPSLLKIITDKLLKGFR